MLREEQVRRYARHVLLPDVGGTGQERLLAARVRFVDVGGAAAEAVAYLAAAGVGTICVLDAAVVSEGDVGALFERADVGRKRLDAARERLAALNPDVRVVATSEPHDIGPPTPTTAGGGAGAGAGGARPDPFDALQTGAALAATLIRAIARGHA